MTVVRVLRQHPCTHLNSCCGSSGSLFLVGNSTSGSYDTGTLEPSSLGSNLSTADLPEVRHGTSQLSYEHLSSLGYEMGLPSQGSDDAMS